MRNPDFLLKNVDFMKTDNELSRARTQGIEKMFSNFGDRAPPPGSNGIEVPGGAEPKVCF